MDKNKVNILQKIATIQGRIASVQQRLTTASNLLVELSDENNRTEEDLRFLINERGKKKYLKKIAKRSKISIFSIENNNLINIMSLLDFKEILKLSRVNSIFFWICNATSLWDYLFKIYYPTFLPYKNIHPINNMKGIEVFKEIFQSNYRWKKGEFSQKILQCDAITNVITLDIIRNNQRIIACSDTQFVEWDLNGKFLNTSMFGGKVNSVSCTNNIIGVGSSNGVVIYDIESKTKIYEITEMLSDVNRICCTDKYISVGCWNGEIRIYKNQERVCAFRGHNKPIYAMDQINELLITGSSDKVLKIWNINSKRQLLSLKSHKRTINDTIFVPNTSHILSASKDSDTILWDIETGNKISVFSHHNESVNCVKALSNDRIFTGSSDKTVCLWDSNSREIIRSFSTQQDYGNVTALYVDPFRLLCGYDSGSVVQYEYRM